MSESPNTGNIFLGISIGLAFVFKLVTNGFVSLLLAFTFTIGLSNKLIINSQLAIVSFLV